ncbi:unnamed protein product [Clonostachys rosea]|uniref:SnoaL-like domain-containing protein n=1 Tax=Bionectria ochroleuca TaxID=29856 RepID=A0ABY6V4L5_BIOOC|nr:unnamed protein product [Clonostachys rosea]
MEPSPEAFAAHAFEYDSATLDKPLADFIQKFYTFSDDKENPSSWDACFTENATMKKATTDVTGREGKWSWKGQASRQHVVAKVFPFSCQAPDEVMLHGVSKYIYDDSTTGEMAWAARLHFKRFNDGKILIDFYHIFPSAPPKAA